MLSSGTAEGVFCELRLYGFSEVSEVAIETPIPYQVPLLPVVGENPVAQTGSSTGVLLPGGSKVQSSRGKWKPREGAGSLSALLLDQG